MGINRLSGLGAWLVQRMSAVYIVAFLLVFSMTHIVSGFGYGTWRGLMAQPYFAMACTLFLFALLFHSWVGMRNVVVDYVHPIIARVVLLFALGGWLCALALWATWIFFRVVNQ